MKFSIFNFNLFGKSDMFCVRINKGYVALYSLKKESRGVFSFVGVEKAMWQESDLTQVLKTFLIKHAVKAAFILLGENLSYVATARLSESELSSGKDLKTMLESKALGIFPEYKQDLIWDYKFGYSEGADKYYVIAGVSSNLIQKISTSFDESKTKFSFIEPVSYFLACASEPNEISGVIFEDDFEAFLMVIKNGAVLVSTPGDDVLVSNFKPELIGQMYQYVKTKFSQEVEELKVISIHPWASGAELEVNGKKVKVQALTGGLKYLSSIHGYLKGKDEEILNIDRASISSLNDSDNPEPSDTIPTSRFRITRLKLMLFVLFIIVSVGIALFAVNYAKKFNKEAFTDSIEANSAPRVDESVESNIQTIMESNPQDDAINASQSAPITPETPVVQEVNDLSKFKVEILNGSGTPGEAGLAKADLVSAGFSDITTGNAGNYDYTKTEVRFKENVSQVALGDLGSKLIRYVLTFPEEKLNADYAYDIQIIVGKDKAELSPTEAESNSPDIQTNGP